jgi:hypothetical protein
MELHRRRIKIRIRRRAGLLRQFSNNFVKRRWVKWVIVFIAFALGASLHEKKAISAYADTIIIGGIPEPSSVSILIGGAALIWLLRGRRK